MSNCHVTAGGGGGAASEPAALPGGVLAPLCRGAWLRGLNTPRVYLDAEWLGSSPFPHRAAAEEERQLETGLCCFSLL